MWQAQELGRLLQRLRSERGISAYALAKTSGLSQSHIRMIERARRRPSADAIAALSHALRTDQRTTAKLRRLAGIDPDPATAPEAKRARAAAWRFLTYMLVNHVLLPRLTLADTIARLAHKAPAAAEHLRAAAAALGRDYCQARAATPAPPRVLRALIEKTFAHLTADDIQHTQPRAIASPNRFTAVSILLDMVPLPRGWTEQEAVDVACNAGFGPFFALRLFPLIYREACRCWPFEKVYMPYAVYGEPAQRAVYELAQTPASVKEFDQTLVGCGMPLARGEPSRHRYEFSRLHEFPDRGLRPAPPGHPDWIFDHWDRCEFLDRFPLLKLELDRSMRLAHSVDLPSLEAHRAQVELMGVPRELILSEAFEDEPLEPLRFASPESFVARRIADEFRVATERLIFGERWAEVAGAGRMLQVDSQVIDLADSLARAPAGTPDPPES